MQVGTLQVNELKAARLANLGLLDNSRSLLAAINRTVGIQAQQPNTATMNALLRSNGDQNEFDQLAHNNEIVRTWGQRWTLQLFTRADFNLVISARNKEKIPKAYYLGHEKLVSTVAQEIVASKVDQWDSQSLDAAFPMVKPLGNLKYVILQSLTQQGRGFYLASSSGTNWRYQVVTPNLADVTSSLRELIGRYLQGFGPASLADFTKWSGIKISMVRPIWQHLTDQMAHYQVVGSDELLVNPEELTAAKLQQLLAMMTAQPIIEAGYDAIMTGYLNKEWLFSKPQQKVMWSKNGILYPPIFEDGQLIGTWRSSIQVKKLQVTVTTWTASQVARQQQLTQSFSELVEKLQLQLADLTFTTQDL